MLTEPRFSDVLARAQRHRPIRLEIDLGGVSFMDSSGLRALILALDRARGDGGEMCLRRVPAASRRLLEITKTLSLFTIVD